MKDYENKNGQLAGWAINQSIVDWIESNLLFGSTILELGSGRGTEHLVSNFDVYSVEEDIKWVGYEPKSNYIHAPVLRQPISWYDPAVLKSELPEFYDLILIDGPKNGTRFNLLNWLHLFRTDVPILVDDIGRKKDGLLIYKLAQKLNRPFYKLIPKGRTKKWGVIMPGGIYLGNDLSKVSKAEIKRTLSNENL